LTRKTPIFLLSVKTTLSFSDDSYLCVCVCVLPKTSSSTAPKCKRPPPLFLDWSHRMKPQTPFCVCVCSKELLLSLVSVKKNVRSFSHIERIFFARVASKVLSFPHKRRRERDIEHARVRTRQQQQQQQQRVHRRLFEKDEYRRGRGSEDRDSFFDAPPTP